MKLWFGVSGDDDRRPLDYEFLVVESEEDIANGLDQITEYWLENFEALDDVIDIMRDDRFEYEEDEL